MAFSGMGSNGGRMGRGRWRSQVGVLSEMNVVPLVDVVLVLLIIFMVTASVMEFGLTVDVPTVKQVRDTTEEHPVISVARDGTTYLNDAEVNINNIGKEVRRRFKDQTGRADVAQTASKAPSSSSTSVRPTSRCTAWVASCR